MTDNFNKMVGIYESVEQTIKERFPNDYNYILENKKLPVSLNDASPSSTFLTTVLEVDPVVIRGIFNNGIFARTGIQSINKGRDGAIDILRRGITVSGSFEVVQPDSTQMPVITVKFTDEKIPLFNYAATSTITYNERRMYELNGINIAQEKMEGVTQVYATLTDDIFAYGSKDKLGNIKVNSYGYLNYPGKTPQPLGNTMVTLAADPVAFDQAMKDAYNTQTLQVNSIMSQYADLMMVSPEDMRTLAQTYISATNASNITVLESLKMYVRQLSGKELTIIPDPRCSGSSSGGNNLFAFMNAASAQFVTNAPLSFYSETILQDQHTIMRATLGGLDFIYDTLTLFVSSDSTFSINTGGSTPPTIPTVPTIPTTFSTPSEPSTASATRTASEASATSGKRLK